MYLNSVELDPSCLDQQCRGKFVEARTAKPPVLMERTHITLI